ncbi:MAG TPA: dephospho-CoA kinase [bacterium]|nr:dephospho-CoA kinase [bacterium]HOL35783.1 dephospho-CoA kinase [bacterium]HPP07831.1 dephospho-CoA kinase [bacterium]
MVRIGLTGVFGSGKSTVSQIFKKMGVPVISCDTIVNRLLKTEKIKEKIAENFGREYFVEDGNIDKKKLARLVFSSSLKRKRLNEIIHPHVFEIMEKKLDTYRKRCKMAVVVEIPLLFETRSEKKFDVIITVFSPDRLIKERLGKRYSPQEVEMRLKSQMPLEKKMRLSDYVIDNSGSLSETRKQVKTILQEIMRRRSICQKKSKN